MLDALNQAVYFGYDLAGNRNVEMDALKHSTYYQYDLGNRLAAVLDPLNKAAYYGYDANSNLAKTRDNNATPVYFGYDALDRRTTIQYPTESQYFGYDAAGNLTRSKDAWGASYFGYDALSRLTRRRTPRQDTVYYGYDGVSNLLRLQYPQDNGTCYFGYDDAQRLIQLQSTAGQGCYYVFDSANDVTQRTMGNGVVSLATFDRTNRMVSLRYSTSGGGSLAYFDYGRDVAGRILRIQRENGAAIYYSYDKIDRLEAEVWRKTSDNSQIYGFWYSYDAANNRLQMRRETTAGTTLDSTYYSYAADNSLTRKQVRTPPSTVVDTYYGYDANGALTQVLEGASATYFGYGANQLVSKIKPPTGSPTYFYYDGRLNRYLIDKAGTLTYYLWDGLNQLEERDASGNLLARYTHGNYRQYGIGSVVEVERHVGAATYYQYPLCDHRGTVYAMVDANQNTQLSYTMDAFGRPLAGIGGADPNVPNDLIYQSNWFTLSIGGRAYGVSAQRLYDMELGVFLQRDPIGSYSGLNTYDAFDNNPVEVLDAFGLAPNSHRSLKPEKSCIYGQIGFNFSPPQIRIPLTPILALDVQSGIRGSGSLKKCTLCCDNSGMGMEYEGKLQVVWQWETGLMLGWRLNKKKFGLEIDLFAGIRGFGGIQVLGEAAVKKDTCKNSFLFTLKGGYTGYVGLEIGARGRARVDTSVYTSRWVGVGVFGRGKAQIKGTANLKCDNNQCAVTASAQGQLSASINVSLWRISAEFGYSLEFEGPESPPILFATPAPLKYLLGKS